ncbi:OmpA family protein [Flavobacterium glaciei]|uniref:OmpA family protein n=1 Tax=Flavobacterium glaciei TaxID=386300 RepID=A0A562PXH4_9FLAO|nr:OmpA family protein [Flavobacterium glaciei]RDI56539.1 OmpA family protein [Flavobacterium glaciei]TWI49109.1 OmpA family protein [Flavobacterium glaciei]
MKNLFSLLFLLFFCYLSAQTKKAETVYFGFDKSKLDKHQIQIIVNFIKTVDTTNVESIQIYGYCDDRGDNDYNYKLSNNRVKTVQDILTSNGFNKNKIVIIEGKGRVILTNDAFKNLNETRSKNRRVDLLIVKKNSFGKGIYNSFQDNHKVGDRVYLETILFPLGSSKLTEQSKMELDKILIILQKQKNIQFEIKGHVCCTPSYYDDAIDKDTHERKLSLNRAKNVYKYLISKGINSLRMKYIGCGNKFPTGLGEALDRRVEFLIVKI